jgi:hypothetical protein
LAWPARSTARAQIYNLRLRRLLSAALAITFRKIGSLLQVAGNALTNFFSPEQAATYGLSLPLKLLIKLGSALFGHRAPPR